MGVGLLLAAILQSRDTADATLRSDALLQRVIVVEQSVVDAETGLRGYLITGAHVFLAPLENAKQVLPSQVRALNGAARADHEFVGQARDLGVRSLSYLATTSRQCWTCLRDGAARRRSLSLTLRGKRLVDSVRVESAVLESAISSQEANRQHAAHESASDAVEEAAIVLALLVTLTIIVGTVVGRLVLSRERARARAEFLAASSRRLDESLSIDAVLSAGAELLAGRFADACALAETKAELAAARRARRSRPVEGGGHTSRRSPPRFVPAPPLLPSAPAPPRRSRLMAPSSAWPSRASPTAAKRSTFSCCVAPAAHGRATTSRTSSSYRPASRWRRSFASSRRARCRFTSAATERRARSRRASSRAPRPRSRCATWRCASVRPAKATSSGGDFYDVFAVSAPKEWAVIVGDVCGKGAQAAAMTAMARWTLRSLPDEPPADALRHLNQAMLRQNLGSRFITVAAMRVRVEDDHAVVAVACGGHPAPIHVRRDGTASAIDAGGDLIGIWADPRLRTAEVRLEPGELLVAFTDGAVDFAAEPLRRLEELLSHLAGGDAAAAATAVELHALEGAAASRDDIAVVAIGFVGRGGARLARTESVLASAAERMIQSARSCVIDGLTSSF